LKALQCLPNFQVGSIKYNQSSSHILAYICTIIVALSANQHSRASHTFCSKMKSA
jgi:hypothetical protein